MSSVIRRTADGEQVRLAIGEGPWPRERVVRFKDRIAVMCITRGMHPQTVAEILGWHPATVYRALSRVPSSVEDSDRALLDLA